MFYYFEVDKKILKPAFDIIINPNTFDTVGSYLAQLSIEDNENNKYLCLPKFIDNTYFYYKYLQPLITKYNIDIKKPKLKKYKQQFDEELHCKYEPMDYQEEVVSEFMNIYKSNGSINGILQLTTGFGKTYLSLYLANKLRLKTLIIVDESELLEQWKDRILEYFPDLIESDVGIIRGDNINVNEDTRFTLAYIQTLNSRLRRNDIEYLTKVSNFNFGLIIFDECHKVSASEKYSKVSSIFNTKNVIGLSATPYKYSIQRIQLESSIGPVIIEKKRYAYEPNLYFIDYRSNLMSKIRNTKYFYTLSYSKDIIKKRTAYSSAITYSDEFINVIKKAAYSLLKDNHKIIIITTTIEACQKIANSIRSIDKNIKVCELHSKYKATKDEIKTSDVIVGTYKKCSHGFDRKDISSVIFATPYSGKISIPQIVGRILREYSGKQQPVVVYLNDLDFHDIFNIKKVNQVFNKEYPNCKIFRFDENGNLHTIKT
jgi:superfamily II DNA or RNA helicase